MRSNNLTLTPTRTTTLRGQDIPTGYTIEGKNNATGTIFLASPSPTEPLAVHANLALEVTVNRVPLRIERAYVVTPGQSATPKECHTSIRRTDGDHTKSWDFDRNYSDAAAEKVEALADEAANLLAREAPLLAEAAEASLRTSTRPALPMLDDDLEKALHGFERRVIAAVAAARVKDESIPLDEVVPSKEGVRDRILYAVGVILDRTTVEGDAVQGEDYHAVRHPEAGSLSIAASWAEAQGVMDVLAGRLLDPEV